MSRFSFLRKVQFVIKQYPKASEEHQLKMLTKLITGVEENPPKVTQVTGYAKIDNAICQRIQDNLTANFLINGFVNSLQEINDTEPLNGDDTERISKKVLFELDKLNGNLSKEEIERGTDLKLRKFKYSIDGVEGDEFEAYSTEEAYSKVLEWSGASVWEVEK